MKAFRDSALRFVAAVSLAATLLAAAAHAQPVGGVMIEPEATEAGSITFELTGVFSRDLTVRFAGDTLLLPFTAFANSLGILNRASKDLDTIAGEMPLGQPFTIAIAEGRLARRGAADTIPPRSIAVVDGEIYVEAGLLARAMGLQIPFDLSDLRVSVIADARIPAVDQARNKYRYSMLRPEGGPEGVPTTIRRELLGSAAIRWGVINTIQNGESNSSGAMQIAGPFLFGVLTAGGTGQYERADERGSLTGALNTLAWQIQFPDFSPLRQMTIGASRGGTATSLTLGLSNAPLGGRRDFGMRSLDGHTQAGWDVELYQDQRLMEVTQADQDGLYHFQVPVGYGATTRTIVQVGPHGERVVEQRTFRLNPALIPPGEVQYNISLTSQSLRFDDRVHGELDLGAGVFNWMTLGASLSAGSSTIAALGPDSVNVAALANFWLGDETPLGVYYNPRSHMAGGAISYNFGDAASVQAGLDSFDILHRNVYVTSGGFNFGMGWMSIGGFGQLANNDLSTTILAAPQLSFYTAGLSVNGSARVSWIKPHAALGGGQPMTAVTSTMQVVAAPFGGMFMMARASYDHQSRSITNIDFSSSVSLTSALNLGVSFNMQGTDWKQGTISSQITYNFGLARIGLGASYRNGELGASNVMEGWMLLSRGGVQAAPYEAVNQSGVIINAFHDANLNGVRDGDEESLNDASADLLSSAAQLHTDDGMFLSLTPYQQATITITHEGFADRGLYPRKSLFDVYTLPASTTVLDVAYAEGFSVPGRGRVILPARGNREGSTAVLTGLKIRLVATDGNAEYEGEMFDDGGIIIDGVSAGYYKIAFDPDQLRSRRLRPVDLPAMVYLNAAGAALPVVTFTPVEEGEDGGIGK